MYVCVCVFIYRINVNLLVPEDILSAMVNGLSKALYRLPECRTRGKYAQKLATSV